MLHRRPIRKSLSAAAVLLTCAAAVTPLQSRAEAPTTSSSGISSEQAAEILSELRQIRQLLERLQVPVAPGPPAVNSADEQVIISFGSGFVLGRLDAPLTLVEFTDYECSFCREFHRSTFEELKKNYIDTGMLRFISRDFPLDFHPQALSAAHAARCAADQGQFWQLRHFLIVDEDNLNSAAMVGLARKLRLDETEFQRCFEAKKYQGEIERDINDGVAAGVSGTPTFVLGPTGADRLEGVKIVGAVPYGVFDKKIKELLAADTSHAR